MNGEEETVSPRLNEYNPCEDDEMANGNNFGGHNG